MFQKKIIEKHNSANKSKIYYQKRLYSNPYFDKKEKKKIHRHRFFVINSRAKLYFSAFSFGFIALVYLFIYSSVFSINHVNVSGTGNIDSEIIKQIAQEQLASSFFVLIPGNNIFIFNKKELQTRLEAKFSFKNLEITKRLPDILNIDFSEKEYAIIWREGEEYYYADKSGSIIAQIPSILEVNQNDYPIIENRKDKKLSENLADIEPAYVDYVLRLFEAAKKIENDFKINYYIIDNDVNTIKTKILDGPELYFNLQSDIDRQIEKVLIIKNEKLKGDFFMKQYIDVRIKDSVYYR